MKDKIEIIIDLIEMRASYMLPMQAGQMEKTENVFKYNFFNVLIVNLCDKYKVKSEDIQEAIRDRHINNLTNK